MGSARADPARILGCGVAEGPVAPWLDPRARAGGRGAAADGPAVRASVPAAFVPSWAGAGAPRGPSLRGVLSFLAAPAGGRIVWAELPPEIPTPAVN